MAEGIHLGMLTDTQLRAIITVKSKRNFKTLYTLHDSVDRDDVIMNVFNSHALVKSCQGYLTRYLGKDYFADVYDPAMTAYHKLKYDEFEERFLYLISKLKEDIERGVYQRAGSVYFATFKGDWKRYELEQHPLVKEYERIEAVLKDIYKENWKLNIAKLYNDPNAV